MIRPALFLPLLALAGCAPGRRYPSLAPRPAEARSFDEPARPAAAVVPDAALDADLVRRGAAFDAIATGFAAAAADADRKVAAATGKPVGSDAWLDAQGALARLDDWRAQASALAAGVEAMGSARAGRLQPAYPALDALAARAATESEREAAETERLQRLLPGA